MTRPIKGRKRAAAGTAGLRGRAEARLRAQRSGRKGIGAAPAEADSQRLVHELQVHQIELELQNAELQEARERMEGLLEKYTDLYDFAPVGYFSLDEAGGVLEANLTSATLFGVERARLLNRSFLQFVAPSSRAGVHAFLARVFTNAGTGFGEAAFVKDGAATFWGRLHGTAAVSISSPRKWCRVTVADITAVKEMEAVHRRVAVLDASNRKLEKEVVRRKTGEASLRQSEQQQRKLLEESRHMQEHLRQLSRQVISAQEDERLRISRELHDVIAQNLTGINIHLAQLCKERGPCGKRLAQGIERTQRLVEKSVEIVHRFARELRPAVLDDLGLIPALQAHLKAFRAQTGLVAELRAAKAVEHLTNERRTVLYRVVQESLANVARHACAKRVLVQLAVLDNAVCLSICDDGKGFDPQSVLNPRAGKRQALGMLGMRERLEMLDGEFSVEAAPGRGTTIQAQLPLYTGKRGRHA